MNTVLSYNKNFEIRFKGIKILKGELTDALAAKGLGYKPQYVDIYSNSWGTTDNGYEVFKVGFMTENTLSKGAFKVYMTLFACNVVFVVIVLSDLSSCCDLLRFYS